MRRSRFALTPRSDSELCSESLFSFWDSSQDKTLWVFGLDEVGRGCLAGPVVAACFAYPLRQVQWDEIPVSVTDSKKLSEEKRELSRAWLETQPEAVHAVCEASVEEIDTINILHASMLAMERAFLKVCETLVEKHGRDAMTNSVHAVFVDGNLLPKQLKNPRPYMEARAVVKGDAKSFAIAAASILAKSKRDTMMAELHNEFPHYAWDSNVGYPTPTHKAALEQHGLTSWHRRSFCKSLL